MEERAVRWERTMLFIQDILDHWIKVQTAYLYLEPLFSFEDINKNLAQEAEKFKMVFDIVFLFFFFINLSFNFFYKLNSDWTHIMAYLENHPMVLSIETLPNVEGILRRCLRWIDEIQHGLEEHLEEKRLIFPRFYFLANEDLLNILAETRDPQLVQPHLKKCFEGIHELNFNTLGDIFGMRSIEEEEILFVDRISPKHYKSNVERWLLKVEEQMRDSLRKLIEDSFMDLSNSTITLTEWVRKWQGQVSFNL
jgi:dynein heavy chain, axonemal